MFHFCSMSRRMASDQGSAPKTPTFSGNLLDVHAQLLGHVAEIERETGRAAEHGGAEVLHEHELALRVAAGDGDDRSADAARPRSERPGHR